MPPRSTRAIDAAKAARFAELCEVARKHGGRCLAREYTGSQDRLEFECSQGHRFLKMPRLILNGAWCTQCLLRGEDRLEEMRALAKERGGVCIAEEYRPAKEKMRFRCGAGHEWDASSSDIREGSWCPKCRGRNTTIAELQAFAARHGGRCLSTKYVDNKTTLRWECKEGHRFARRLGPLRRSGWWCPMCLKLDGSVAKALEIAKERGGRLLSTRGIGPNARLRWQCAKGHEWYSKPVSVATGRRWCLDCRRLGIEQMQQLAAARDGKCLSTEYVNAFTHLLWECELGHQWRATPSSIKHAKSWCPECGAKRAQATRRAEARDRR